MPKAHKLENGKWRIRVYDASNTVSHYKCITGDTQEDAERKAAQYLYTRKELAAPSSYKTLRGSMDEFIDNRNNVLSPTTIALYRTIARTAFIEIQNTKVNSLTQTLLQKTINQYCQNHAYKTVANATAFLAVVLKEYRPDFTYKIHMPQKSRAEITIPTREEVKLLLEHSAGDPVYLPILLASQLGLRRGEVCALTWEDINIDERTLRIDESLAEDEFGTLIRKKPKTTQSERTLKLTQQIIDNLPPRGAQIITIAPKTITKHFTALAKELGLKCTYHSLRHYYASIMLQLGIPDKYAMERMGHSTNHMLKRVYQHTFESEHESINEKLQHYFDASRGEK